MLVISLKKDPDGNLHVMNGLKDHVGPDKEKWFLSILAEINSYLPDDWRLTKRGNNFRIQVVTPQAHFSMVGECFRVKNSTNILNIIDTVLDRHDFDIKELEQKHSKINKSLKSQNPALIQPNLYFFQPCPEDSISPLFARQYERVKKYSEGKKNQFSGVQYHRIHPLTKTGLDLEHYKWVKWDINGNIEFVDYPDDEYHGKDYWILPFLNKQRAAEETYIKQYQSLMEKYFTAGLENNSFFPPPHERELKYLFTGTENDFHKIYKDLQKKLETEGYGAIWGEEKEQRDIYFDDENFSLYHNNISFRMRKKKDNARITLKKRIPADEPGTVQGLYLRLEEEVTISKAQEEALLNNERINPFPYRLIYYLAPECRNINKVLELNNRRKTGLLTDEKLRRIEICRDIVTYKIDNLESEPVYELEIESKGAEAEIIDILAAIIVDDYGLQPSTKTKYECGVELLKKLKNDDSCID
jgi:adenylate cyclase class IV